MTAAKWTLYVLIAETESAKWPTASARDYKDTPGMAQDAFDKSGKFRNRIDQLARSVYHVGRLAQENHSTNGKNPEPLTANSIPPGSPS